MKTFDEYKEQFEHNSYVRTLDYREFEKLKSDLANTKGIPLGEFINELQAIKDEHDDEHLIIRMVSHWDDAELQLQCLDFESDKNFINRIKYKYDLYVRQYQRKQLSKTERIEAQIAKLQKELAEITETG